MQTTQPGELGILETWNGPKHPYLFRMFEFGLEANDVVERAERIVLPQLNDRIRSTLGMGIKQTDRLHWTKTQGLRATRRHHFDRQAAFKIRGGLLPFLEVGLFTGQQGVDEIVIDRLVERAVDIIRTIATGTRAAGAFFVIA